ncbi:putative flavoprotein involved in K+ transport [Enhydrobacter aerosaccus]|uniref:Putative flavoprotein involved in K+ transport n=1 Tax=Enhydrobacter aerosaccus TaxID=225324 RepID=A0A1T4THI4_9HYPH|nr:NAD(P)/FAD-dependent oxidoreductase [Enhydrobacter aerosaccus]SKA39922.1 putative flavoprotein involved in K+ transport [Enhydrobacter aerosaccus]
MNIPDKSLATTQWLDRFARALQHNDIAAALALFADTSYWRDLVAFTWNIVTFEGQDAIGNMLQARLADVQPHSFVIDGADGWFTFETEVGRGRGHLRLKDGKAWTFLTALTELKSFEEKSGPTREIGTQHGAIPNRVTWTDRRQADTAELGITRQPFVLIVGAGQGGLGLGARLKRLGVPTLIVDRHERPGDAWRKRYKSLCLHDPVWYDHLPYLPFPDHWPIYTPKDKMGDWLEAYAKIMELDIWNSTACKSAAWDEVRSEWTVEVDRAGESFTLKPKHLVLATGMSGFPQVPRFPGADRFRGTQHHSSDHPGGEGWSGKRCVVVGANNSAHDIAGDLWEHGADVTMIQRSPTLVARSETLARIGRPLYSEEAVHAGITTEIADFTAASWPYALQPAAARPVTAQMKKEDADFYDRLKAAGFQLTFGEDETGIGQMYMRRGSGYYIDVGASDLIADGRIKLCAGVEIDHLTESAVVLKDGRALAADLVVYATGYGSMNQWAAALISQEVADKVGKCWGLGSDTAKDPGPWEGELRNMWKPTAQEGLWFHGGNLAQSRHYSRYLALQLKARLERIATPVYGMTPVHHRA